MKRVPPFRLTIWMKIFSVTIAILLIATIPTAVQIYSSVKIEAVDREWQVVSSESQSKAAEVRLIFDNLVERATISAGYLVKEKSAPAQNKSVHPFYRDNDLLSVEVIRIHDGISEILFRESKTDLFAQYGLSTDFIRQLRTKQGFPWNRVFEGKIEIQNASGIIPAVDKTFAIATIGIPFSKDESGRIDQILLADFHLSALQKPFHVLNESTSYLVDSSGVVLAHRDQDKAVERTSVANFPLIQYALEHQLQPQYQSKFVEPGSDEEFIGSYVRTPYGPVVVFQTPLKEILAPAEAIKKEFIKNLCYAVFAAILIISLLSSTLTFPIEKLASLIELVAKGNFDVEARKSVRSRDEVGDLAKAFDRMTVGLKERDKVKSLFSKFHGSSVAEDILNNQISLGGQSKDVVVFFSDVRGFTAFSESRSPEEVVEMLNEYFSIMVRIINKHHGVVDKFIGDAIMAIWGAPKTTGEDCVHALRACLEMRQALADLNEVRIQRRQDPLWVGMGLHAGPAVSGIIGHEERMEYTVIGNTVNTASRIEASTKAFGADLLVTEQVLEKVGDHFLVEFAGQAEVKGRSEPIKMFIVKGYRDPKTGEIVEVKTPYSEYEREKADKVKIAS